MKKLITMIAVLACVMIANAQNYEVLHIEDLIDGYEYDYCADEFDGIIIHKAQNCPSGAISWSVGIDGEHFDYWTDSIILQNTHVNYRYVIGYSGCSIHKSFDLLFHYSTDNVNPFAESFLWKRTGESTTLVFEPMNWNMEVQWSTGETENEITVTEPGTYSVTITDVCGSETYTIQVRDNVELYRATCDLRSNLNQVTWQTTPQQAEYISAVNIYRNTYQLIATVPYLDGSFTDNIGSESTQWQYHIVGVDNEGNECPIPSYWKRTIHLDHVQGTGGGEILQWTPYEEENPAKDVVVAYAIYDVVNGEPNHVMDVGNFTNVYAYNPNDFDGYGTVAAVFAAKDMEDLAFSNLTSEVLGVGETQQKHLSVYPNPTNGTFTVQGAKTLTIYNTMGQVVARSDNNEGKHTLSLAPGVYFIKSDEGTTQKVVVE